MHNFGHIDQNVFSPAAVYCMFFFFDTTISNWRGGTPEGLLANLGGGGTTVDSWMGEQG